MMKETYHHPFSEELLHFRLFVKWILLAMAVGIGVGGVAVIFYHCLRLALAYRLENPNIVFLLPLGGICIVAMYRFSGVRQCKGTNRVISSIRSDEQIPLKMAPLIFLSTCITHLFGGSAGREGAALQLGGSLAHQFGLLCKLDEKDIHIITMCGMSAAFSALFGTPLSAAIFPMEVVSVGVMYYAALVPCALSSIIACSLAQFFQADKEAFLLAQIPALSIEVAGKVIVLALLCALLARLFCLILHTVSEMFSMYIQNQYMRIVIGSCMILCGYLLFGGRYLGAGMDVIEASMHGEVIPFAFLLKLLFTAVTLGCGFKGGEIVPSFFIGATFGAWIASLLQLPPSFAAAIGFMSVFCGVTNCPISALFISFELFGFVAVPCFLLAAAVSYMLSGYESLYQEQKIMYSKFSSKFIDQK